MRSGVLSCLRELVPAWFGGATPAEPGVVPHAQACLGNRLAGLIQVLYGASFKACPEEPWDFL